MNLQDWREEETRARTLDARDPLRGFRSRFHIPLQNGKPAVYLCGHSLGLQPKAARAAVAQELENWAALGVRGHFMGRSPWFSYHETFRAPAAKLVGARPREAVLMNSLTVNLHLMMASFYRPSPRRFKIVTEEPAFPSDLYAVKSRLRLHGYNPKDALIVLRPRAGEFGHRPEDFESMLGEEGGGIALILLSGVNFLTGQALPIRRMTSAAHAHGALIGWDLAHAAGNIPLALHDWNVDFAVWCSYKYLNGGPGAVGGCFVHDRHGHGSMPRMAGWWGHDPRTRFRMQLEPNFKPQPGAEGWQLSNPPILSLAPLKASLSLFEEAGMKALRAKSKGVTAYLQELLDRIPAGCCRTITPRNPEERGCQLSLLLPRNARRAHQTLERAGIVCDFREPNILRVAPVPLYNGYRDAWKFASVLARALEDRRGRRRRRSPARRPQAMGPRGNES